MQQLSRPYQIALGAIVVFALAYFLVLKPSNDGGGETAAAPTAPGQAGLSTAVDKAKGAVGTANGAAATEQATSADPTASTATTGTPASAAPGSAVASGSSAAAGTTGSAEPDVAAGDPSTALLRSAARGKVVVLLFSGRNASDDNKVRGALAASDKHGGRVVVRSASINRAADYAAITQGVTISQSPTLVVFGKADRAKTIVGYTDTRSIDQLVSDVGGPRFVPTRFRGYRGQVENLCATRNVFNLVGTFQNGGDVGERLSIGIRDLQETLDAAVALRPERKYVAMQKRLLADVRLSLRQFRAARTAQTRSGDSAALAALLSFDSRANAADMALIAAARRAGVTGCTGS